ncbi:MAG: hypothetical protein M3Z02_03345 [Actinomycetota bacterium]|nr:hypothetical protein [Actinomycetota bacterium]
MPGEEESRPSARDLVRKRRVPLRRAETGRHHHMGAAPARQPELSSEGVAFVDASAVQLAGRTDAQLRAQRELAETEMRAAAAAAEFEQAARRRDAVAAIDAELLRRSGQDGSAQSCRGD